MTDVLLNGMLVFVLAMFVGFEAITKIPPTLYTPLMSGTNATSGVTPVAARAQATISGTWRCASG